MKWWVNDNRHCIDDGVVIPHSIEPLFDSQKAEFDQTYCYDITSAFNYKIWQMNPVGNAVKCTFVVYSRYACKGLPIKTTHLPKKANIVMCVDSIVAPEPEPKNDWWSFNDYDLFPFQESKSVRFSCKCDHSSNLTAYSTAHPTPKWTTNRAANWTSNWTANQTAKWTGNSTAKWNANSTAEATSESISKPTSESTWGSTWGPTSMPILESILCQASKSFKIPSNRIQKAMFQVFLLLDMLRRNDKSVSFNSFSLPAFF